MDVSLLVQTTAAFLSPFLPYLLKLGDKAAEEAAKGLGKSAWEKAKELWARLRGKVAEKPAAQEAVQDAAASPQDEDAQAAWRNQLKKLLAEDAALAQEMARLVRAGQQAGVIVIASGNHSKAAGRDIIEIKMK